MSELNIYTDLYLEEASSNRSTCRTCGRKIDKGILRWCSVEDFQIDEGYITNKYYHTGCLPAEVGHPMVDYNQKKQTGTLVQMSVMPSSKVEKELFNSVVNKYVEYRRMKDGKKKTYKKKAQSESSSEESLSGSDSEEEVKPKPKEKVKTSSSSRPNDELGAYDVDQKKKYKQKLVELKSKTIAQLKVILKTNNQIQSGNKEQLVVRVADGFVLGAIPQCTKCGGGKLRFNQSTGEYSCPGYMEDTDKIDCDGLFKSDEVVRFDWTD